jgi:hypothetical protein
LILGPDPFFLLSLPFVILTNLEFLIKDHHQVFFD